MSEQQVSLRLRPRFSVESPLSMQDLISRIQTAIKRENSPICGEAMIGHATIKLPPDQILPWTPRITMTLEPLPNEKGTLVRGMFSPEPTIWTFFMFLYVIMGFSLLIVLMWGGSLYALDEEAGVLWLAPLLALGMLAIWIFSRVGQKMSAPQMAFLHQELETILEQPLE
jgi:hypothetical protein